MNSPSRNQTRKDQPEKKLMKAESGGGPLPVGEESSQTNVGDQFPEEFEAKITGRRRRYRHGCDQVAANIIPSH